MTEADKNELEKSKKEVRTFFEKCSQEELDERVYDAKDEEAATINNQGREAQIEYLMNR